MGEKTFHRTAYHATRKKLDIEDATGVTRRAEQKARSTNKLDPMVDPSVDAIRRSLLRFDPAENGRWKVTIGCPMDIESITDTTGSMGHNVDVAMEVLPDTYELCSQVLPGYDPQFALGIFGDVVDAFPFQQMQFEMEAEKLVECLANMTPERKGGDNPEDPQYGLFAAAYLRSTYANRIGLKGYHFATSDAPMHNRISEDQLIRIFGDTVFDKIKENGYQIDRDYLPMPKEVVSDLLKRTHAFFLQVGEDDDARENWTKLYGAERVIALPNTKYLPHVKAVIIGLTEGTLQLEGVVEFLMKNNMSETEAKCVQRSVSKIPIGAQATLRAKIGHALPKAGDIFANKTDLWPVDATDIVAELPDEETDDIDWLE